MKEKSYSARKGISWRDLYSSVLNDLYNRSVSEEEPRPAQPTGLARSGVSSSPAKSSESESLSGSGAELHLLSNAQTPSRTNHSTPPSPIDVRSDRSPDITAQVETIMSDHNYAFVTPQICTETQDQDLDDGDKEEIIDVTCDCSALMSLSQVESGIKPQQQLQRSRRNKQPHIPKYSSQQSLVQNLGMNLRSRKVNLKTCHRCPCHR